MKYASLIKKGILKVQLVIALTVFMFLISAALDLFAQVKTVNLVSDSPLEYYAQGGVVVDGIAYFTSDDEGSLKTGFRSPEFHFIVAFDMKTLRKIRTYHFVQTYDNSPFLFQKKDGTWLIITPCPCIIACGMVLSGCLHKDRVIETRISVNSKIDWFGPFGNPQTNTFVLPHEHGVTLVPMVEIVRPSNKSSDTGYWNFGPN